jgi:hypothetical protein
VLDTPLLFRVSKWKEMNMAVWNQLPAGLLASFLCNLNTFRKRAKNVVASKAIQVGIECT